MLADALTYCRDRRLSTEAFRSALEQTRDSAYPGGSRTRSTISCDPSSDLSTVTKNASEGTGERVRETVIGPDRERLLDADRELYDAWDARIDDFCTVLSAYRTRYRAAVRGVRCGLAHGRRLPRGRVLRQVWRAIGPPRAAPLRRRLTHRDRILRTYRSRIRVWSSTRHRTCLPSSTPRSRTS